MVPFVFISAVSSRSVLDRSGLSGHGYRVFDYGDSV